MSRPCTSRTRAATRCSSSSPTATGCSPRAPKATSPTSSDGLAAPGIELWEAPHWRADGEHLEEIEALEPGPLDLRRELDLLADAPPGVHAELLDAALAGPIVLVEDDPERRAAWIAWLAATVPGPLTFATFTTRPLDVRVSATTHEHAAAFRTRSTPLAPRSWRRAATPGRHGPRRAQPGRPRRTRG